MSDEQEPISQREENASQDRLQKLVDLLERDHLGYRLERFVAAEREELAQALMTDAFSLRQTPKTWKDLFVRVQAYDEVVLPYVEFFAVGCAYSAPQHASIWTDFLERTAICNYKHESSNNQHLKDLSLYPSLILLYGAGLYAALRRSWRIPKVLLTHPIAVDSNEVEPYVRLTNTYRIMDESGQKVIPNREQQRTPLLNHIYDALKPLLSHHALSEARFVEAYAYFEVILGVTYAYVEEQEMISKGGEGPERYWTPPARYWWQDYGRGTSLDRLAKEASTEGQAWPPTVAGLFGSKSDAFLTLVPKVKAEVVKRGWW